MGRWGDCAIEILTSSWKTSLSPSPPPHILSFCGFQVAFPLRDRALRRLKDRGNYWQCVLEVMRVQCVIHPRSSRLMLSVTKCPEGSPLRSPLGSLPDSQLCTVLNLQWAAQLLLLELNWRHTWKSMKNQCLSFIFGRCTEDEHSTAIRNCSHWIRDRDGLRCDTVNIFAFHGLWWTKT